MRFQLVHVKAATEGDHVGTLQCLNGFIRKRIMEHLGKLEGVQNVKHIAWNIVYFETKDGIKAQNVLEAVHVVLPIFAAEMDIYPSWLIRNFWILWAIALGICHLLDTVEYYLDGGTSIITGHWLAGLAVVGISLVNYVFQRRRYELRAEFVRKEYTEQLKKVLEKEAGNGGTNNDN